MAKLAKLIMMRHGESVWNKANLFTGWVDVPLSEKGVQEALDGGKKIADLPIDIIFVSALIRAKMTAMLAMVGHSSAKTPVFVSSQDSKEDPKFKDWAKIYSPEAQLATIPVFSAWELNERMYGELQGLNKAETKKKFGEEQVQIWRRSYEVPPPQGESLEMTAGRAIPYFKDMIFPHLKNGKNVFISAHGNSLRAIAMYLEELSKEQVVKLEIGTGVPIIYEYNGTTCLRKPSYVN